MNDPDSYEHVETVYWDMTDYVVVQTTYSGKNAFGGRVKNSVKAKADNNGNIIEIIDIICLCWNKPAYALQFLNGNKL